MLLAHDSRSPGPWGLCDAQAGKLGVTLLGEKTLGAASWVRHVSFCVSPALHVLVSFSGLQIPPLGFVQGVGRMVVFRWTCFKERRPLDFLQSARGRRPFG